MISGLTNRQLHNLRKTGLIIKDNWIN